jgi:aryl-alcohol dehydrogenase-like predicted oxidoreductase
MKYRRLGDTGTYVSEIGLGGWLTFGNALSTDAARDVMDAAFDLGITFLDNADAYAQGTCEEVWGELLSGRPRDAFVLATKVFFPMGDAPTQKGLGRKHVMESCHNSLRRLRTDHIDLYQCHRFDEETPLEETVRAMDDLVRQGKVVYWGFSQWSPAQIQATLELCDGEGFYRPKSSQPSYSALERSPEAEVFPLCHENGIGQVCYSPLAQGVLTGKYKPGEPAPGTSRAKDDRQNRFIKRMVDDRDLLERVQGLVPVAEEVGCTMAQLALAYALRRPEVSSLIVGASRPQQLRDNAEASGIELDEATVRRIEETLEG